MQPSPLQLAEIFFIRSEVKPRIEPDVSTPPTDRTRFRFSKTDMTSTVEHAMAPDDAKSEFSSVLVTLRLTLDDEGEAPAPYVVDIKCAGYFTIHKGAFPDEKKRYDVAVVNGASILYGAIREQLLNITSRMWYGEVLLPAVNFMQVAPSADESNQSSVTTEKPKRASRSKKSNVNE